MSGRAQVQTLTVMFTDLVGSTELFARLGEDAADEVRHRHFGMLGKAVTGHGGREIQRLGDGLYAGFQSACEAVACATAIQNVLHDEAALGRGHPLAARIGISSGDVAVEGDDRFGEAVTEASRLCACADGGEILIADVVRGLMRGRGGHALAELGPMRLKGLPAPVSALRVEWTRTHSRGLRAVIADDAVLVREGVARLLEDNGISVVAQANDAVELLKAVELSRPDLVITDIRMPPTNTVEGLQAAHRIRAEFPKVSVLVLSQHLDPGSARRLVADQGEGRSSGVGYLLKERVGDVEDFIDILRRVSKGECVLDPDLTHRWGTEPTSLVDDDEGGSVIALRP